MSLKGLTGKIVLFCNRSLARDVITACGALEVSLEDQHRIVCIEFQYRLFCQFIFLTFSHLKLQFYSEIAETDEAAKYWDTNCKRMC